MCRSEERPPKAIRADSTFSSLGTDEASIGFEDGDSSNAQRYSTSYNNGFKRLGSVEEEQRGVGRFITNIVAGSVMGAAFTGFALWFPFALAPEAASKTYDWAFYTYDESLSHFDNTPWTYGTDYALAVIMALSARSIMQFSVPGVSRDLCFHAAGLLLGYSVSVTAGGYCHHTYTTLESRNTLSFRVLWTICVGTVSAATGYMGSSGTEVIRKFQQQPGCSPHLRKIPVVPESFWWAFALLVTGVTAWGGMSFQRPACDIFIAGITQFPSTFYLMVFFLTVEHPKATLSARIMGLIGFIMNAPLLPMYPLLIQYTDLSLAAVNTLLHSWLCVAWSLQGYSLREMIRALVETRQEEKARLSA